MKKILLLLLFAGTTCFSSELSNIIQACDNKVETACYELGLLHEKGLGVEKDIAKTKEYFLKACEHGYDKACKKYEEIMD